MRIDGRALPSPMRGLGVLVGREAATGAVRRLPPGSDPAALVSLAERHGLAGMLYAGIVRAGLPAGFPGDELERLRRVYLLAAARRLQLAGEARRVADILGVRGIPILLLKGMGLAGRVYPDAGARPMSDVDILVPRERFDEANRLLAARGYRRIEEGVKNFDPVLGEHLWRTGVYLPPPDAGPGVSTDMLDRLQYFGRDLRPAVMREKMAGLWRRALPHPGVPGTRVLSPEDELVYLCVHAGLLHIPLRLLSLCDVDRLLARYEPGFRWDAVLDAAVRLDAAAPVAHVLEAASDFLATPIPGFVRDGLAGATKAADRWLVRRAASEPGSRLHQHLYYLFRCRRLRLRMALVKAYLAPDERYLRARFGAEGGPRSALLLRRLVATVTAYGRGRGS